MGSGSIYPDISYTGRRIGRWFAGLPPAFCGRMLEAVKSAGDDPPASCAGYNMAAACR